MYWTWPSLPRSALTLCLNAYHSPEVLYDPTHKWVTLVCPQRHGDTQKPRVSKCGLVSTSRPHIPGLSSLRHKNTMTPNFPFTFRCIQSHALWFQVCPDLYHSVNFLLTVWVKATRLKEASRSLFLQNSRLFVLPESLGLGPSLFLDNMLLFVLLGHSQV